MNNRQMLICKSAIPGGAIAMMMSYALNQSIFFAIVHMLLGWMYVIYWLFTYTEIREWIMQWAVYA